MPKKRKDRSGWMDYASRALSKRMELPLMAECPRCHAEHEDHDGVGVLYCAKCGYCTHASVNGNRCSFCNATV